MALALLATANPLPVNNDSVLVKKALKQYDMRRATAEKREDDKPKPSKHWRAAEPEPTFGKREDYKPKPSKHWRAAEPAPTYGKREEYKPKPSKHWRRAAEPAPRTEGRA
ncbi:hypothetical protein C8Q80DRAFT_1275960 [Daedaleopsis nitida]|nr:hypothetical protein C8Q80DRAFT_1275960 [Daedaleopsis nitida]